MYLWVSMSKCSMLVKTGYVLGWRRGLMGDSLVLTSFSTSMVRQDTGELLVGPTLPLVVGTANNDA